MLHFTPDDGPNLIGQQMIKQPSPVTMLQISEPFTVATNEGTLSGKPGDYVAYDPKSGHVWPVASSYVAMHYKPATA